MSPYLRGVWICYLFGYVGSSDPAAQFSWVPTLRKQPVVCHLMLFLPQRTSKQTYCFVFSGIRRVAKLNTVTPPFYMYLVLWDWIDEWIDLTVKPHLKEYLQKKCYIQHSLMKNPLSCDAATEFVCLELCLSIPDDVWNMLECFSRGRWKTTTTKTLKLGSAV